MTQPPVPFLDLRRAFAPLKSQVEAVVGEIFTSQRFILGEHGEALERECAALMGTPHAVAVASGTDALLLAYRALDLGPGDEVVTSAFSFFASAGAIVNAGARPVLADIDPVTFNLDVEAAAAAVTSRTRAFCPVHLFGLAADVPGLRQAADSTGLFILEDAAQAIGASHSGQPVGSLGNAAAFSFFPTKNLGGAGDGGLISAADESFAARVRVLRHHGQSGTYEHAHVGTNSRLDEIQAAVLRIKLPHLDAWTAARRANAARLALLLRDCGAQVRDGGRLQGADISLPAGSEGATHVYNLFTVRARRRDQLQRHLQARGVGCGVYYPLPLHLQPCFRFLGYGEGSFPAAEEASREVLSLPIFPGLTSTEMERVAAAVGEFYGGGSTGRP